MKSGPDDVASLSRPAFIFIYMEVTTVHFIKTLTNSSRKQLLIIALLFAALIPGLTWAQVEMGISFDGKTETLMPVSAESGSSSGRENGYRGKNRVTSADLFELGIEGHDWENGNVPAAILEAEKGALPASPWADGEVATESVLGKDRSQRLFTKDYPQRAVAYITFQKVKGGGTFRCTGWLIGRDTVATAGHCVHAGNGGNWFYGPSFKIYPGRDGTKSPFGVCSATRLYTNTAWTGTGSNRDRYDYGAIKLSTNCGNATGWFGYYWKSASLKNHATILQGYPGGKKGNTRQWITADRNRCDHSHKIFYGADTDGGQSGGPIWNDTTKDGAFGMGIHAYGPFGTGCWAKYNSGTRIREAVFNLMKQWKAAAK